MDTQFRWEVVDKDDEGPSSCLATGEDPIVERARSARETSSGDKVPSAHGNQITLTKRPGPVVG